MEGAQYRKPEHLISYQPQLTAISLTQSGLLFTKCKVFCHNGPVVCWPYFPDEEAQGERWLTQQPAAAGSSASDRRLASPHQAPLRWLLCSVHVSSKGLTVTPTLNTDPDPSREPRDRTSLLLPGLPKGF